MLSEICAEIRNYFVKPCEDIHKGDFVISNGVLESAPFLQDGQYFRIIGSIFNDGVWKYGVDTLKDETFNGEVWAMRVPQTVIDLSDAIDAWNEENKDTLSSPFQSESFGGYSYSKQSTGGYGSSANAAYSWKNQFATALNPWRRLSVL